MSDVPPNIDGPGAQPPEGGRGRARPASVELRTGAEAADDALSLMDPAAKSLADALKITYRLLQLAMMVLLALFFFSGFESVNQGERAIRLVFGRITTSQIGAGFAWSLPHPFGELIKVQTNAPSLAIENAFWPLITEAEKNLTVDQLAGGGRGFLDPAADGSVITGDGSIAHLKCQVKYKREDVARLRQRIDPNSEADLVSAAVRRGIVRAAASMTIDQIINNQGVEPVALKVAQETLDKLDCGLTIEQLSVVSPMPPRSVANEYNAPQAAQSEATKQETNAEAVRAEIQGKTAGNRAGVILREIDRYDQELRLGDSAGAQKRQETIFKLLTGEKVEIDGRTVSESLDGEVPRLLREAQVERDAIVNAARADAARFHAIRASYAANPDLVINREWTEAFKTFLKRSSVQVQILPATSAGITLLINRDPNLAKEQETEALRLANLARQKAANEARERENRDRKIDPNAVPSSPN